MKRFFKSLFFLLFFAFISTVSCSTDGLTRTVKIVIPEHPWEIYTGGQLWYYLKYGSSSDNIKSLYIAASEREISIKVPLGVTIYFCAYPLGEMQGFGDAICPEDSRNTLYLNSNRGFLADLFLKTSGNSAGKINFPLLCSYIDEITDKYRLIDGVSLVTDTMNGILKQSSIKTAKTFKVPSFAISNGVWISEIQDYGRFTASSNMSPDFELPPGIYRYLNFELQQELRIVLDSSGQIFSHIRQSLF